MFVRYSLRTVDVEAARAFYSGALGIDFSLPVERTGLEAWPLHERARAAGAPPHWLGHVETADFEGSVQRVLAFGGERLGPTVKGPDGTSYAALRDPTGAVVAIRERTPPAAESRVAWHHLHTRDTEGAWPVYASSFGWHAKETFALPGVEGGALTFAWAAEGPSIGSVANTARLEGVHVHWLYYFRVTDLDATLALMNRLGGKALEPAALPDGRRLVACEDPQGAAFGLISTAR